MMSWLLPFSGFADLSLGSCLWRLSLFPDACPLIAIHRQREKREHAERKEGSGSSGQLPRTSRRVHQGNRGGGRRHLQPLLHHCNGSEPGNLFGGCVPREVSGFFLPPLSFFGVKPLVLYLGSVGFVLHQVLRFLYLGSVGQYWAFLGFSPASSLAMSLLSCLQICNNPHAALHLLSCKSSAHSGKSFCRSRL